MQAKINLELKYRCNDFEGIREELKKIGAKRKNILRQKDYFFNLPETTGIPARLKLRIQDGKQVLVFYKRADFSEQNSAPADVFLYAVRDKELLNFLCSCLGIKAIVIKKRELWQKENTVFHLDEIENIGKIFEIEIRTNEKNRIKDEQMLQEYKKRLSPFLDKIVKGSNVDLMNA